MGITTDIFVIKKRVSLCLVVLPVVLAVLLCLVLFWQWKQFGMTDKKNPPVENRTYISGDGPQLLAQSMRVAQGQGLLLSQMAQARDERGNDINSHLIFRCHTAGIDGGRFSTERAGIHEVEIEVKSPVSGKTAEKTIQLLVDGRVME